MKVDHIQHCALVLLAFALALPTSGLAPAFAQDLPKVATEKWRPKDGDYGVPGKGPDVLCEGLEALGIRLTEKHVVGYEWSCDVTGITDTAPGNIRLDMSCVDINLAQSLDPRNEERIFKEVMLINKIDEKTIFIRKTSNGRFRGHRWRASYCPDEQQQRAAPPGGGPSVAPAIWPR